MSNASPRRIAVITCYKQPDYVRAVTLRRALEGVPGVQVVVVKNRRTGVLRYPEVAWRTWRMAREAPADAYLLTFRGYELLPWLLRVAGARPVLFDEFINPLEWLAEHRFLRLTGRPARILGRAYASLLRRCALVLTDTPQHADFSAGLLRLPRGHFQELPVATDEELFTPGWRPPREPPFTVFYYGNMLPLHGIDYVAEAAEKLAGRAEIEFLIVGGGAGARARLLRARALGARIRYRPWVAFEDIPGLARAAGLCLGGPFGDTMQARMVVTGKTYQFLAAGAPVVVGTTEASGLLRDRHNCLAVPLADAAALTDAIAWAADHPAELAEIAANGSATYKEHFSVAAVTEALRDRLADLD